MSLDWVRQARRVEAVVEGYSSNGSSWFGGQVGVWNGEARCDLACRSR